MAEDPIVFLLDVDNTLLDNDGFVADLSRQLDEWFGEVERQRYWAIYERLREAHGYADYLGAVQLFRSGLENHPDLLKMSGYLLDYPFVDRLYPHAFDVVTYLRALGAPVILSDGDAVFQPRKIQRSGLWDALDGAVLVYPHKQRMIDSIQRNYPAAHYVAVDDKPALLAAMKRLLGRRLTTIFVRQGHYAAEGTGDVDPQPDLALAAIADMRQLTLADVAVGSRPGQ
jgi:FMN phosphatase YigB (HAD superfamily)